MTTLHHETTGNLNNARPASPPGEVDDLEPIILATGATLIPITVMIVTLRIATGRLISKLHVDDYVCLFTLSLGIAQWGTMYRVAQLGVAKHSWDVPLTAITRSVYQIWMTHALLGMVSFLSTKVLILTFYLRLFGTIRWVRRTCYTLLVLCLIIYGTIGVWYIAGCVPSGWSSKLPVCEETGPLILMGGAFTVAVDVLLFVLPFPIIWRLHLDRAKKRGLVVLFLFAILIIATSTVSLAYRVSIVINGTEDPSWDGAQVSITAYVEIFGTVIVACAPALYTFWTRIFTQTRTYTKLRSMLGLEPQRQPDISLGTWNTWRAANETRATTRRPNDMATESSQDLIQAQIPMNRIQKTVTVTHRVEEQRQRSLGSGGIV
ncbi:hypothetical protein B0T21DRAFT_371363 [Apiosordaria backusii]|uniref:Rhodopsin domain-containing protein n=1 Tax=Apiosordaria backusii TaxID=314023 RepID=A0AA40B2B7_9PEZI|nr:hypothetical protein B0T21DRAFT_371363 [Apiosordaria backusii]